MSWYWKGISSPSGKDDSKKIEKKNPTTALNILMCYMLINEDVSCLHFETQSWKTNHSFNNSKQRRIALSCS